MTLGKGVVTIKSRAFYDAPIQSIQLPDTLETIETHAFFYSKLVSIHIPASVTSIHYQSFGRINCLETITVDEKNPFYHSSGNCLIETSTKKLIIGCQTSSIPLDGSVTSIGERAFDCCEGITSIIIPDSVRSIGSKSFSSCTSLESITFQGTIEQWNLIEKGILWNKDVPATVVHCIDGDVAI